MFHTCSISVPLEQNCIGRNSRCYSEIYVLIHNDRTVIQNVLFRERLFLFNAGLSKSGHWRRGEDVAFVKRYFLH
jgi:hypothetical protein